MLTLTYFTTFSSVSIVVFEQVNVSWEATIFDYRGKKEKCINQKQINK